MKTKIDGYLKKNHDHLPKRKFITIVIVSFTHIIISINIIVYSMLFFRNTDYMIMSKFWLSITQYLRFSSMNSNHTTKSYTESITTTKHMIALPKQ